MRLHLYFSAALLAGATMASAAIPSGYYSSLEGKSGSALKQAAAKTAAGHTEISYGEATWEAFKTTDAITVDGREAWWDMYSNNIVYISTGHAGLNIEHSVPNSWWGGVRDAAYKDLFHLNPSNEAANNKKGNSPLGQVAKASWTNGVSTIGTPAAGFGGGASTVFEPADEYKGDFARAYFYIFTVYDQIDWQHDSDWMYDCAQLAYPTLTPWAAEMLLDWARRDPVDQKEIDRNEAVSAWQKNRNPFIDIPELAEYIWGDRKDKVFHQADVSNPGAVNRPQAPAFEGDFQRVGLNSYTGRWWDGFTLYIETGGLKAEYSVDGSEWTAYTTSGIFIREATAEMQQTTVRARLTEEKNGLTLTSPVSILTLTSKDPDIMDYTGSTWSPVTSLSGLDEETRFVIKASGADNIMSYEKEGKNALKAAAGCVMSGVDITGIPVETAVLRLEPADSGKYLIEISSTTGAVQGYYHTTAAKQMSISSIGSAASVSFDSEGNAVIDFGSTPGCLLYNSTQPRFTNYTSKQAPVRLYRMQNHSTVTELPRDIPTVSFDGYSLTVPDGCRVYDINGLQVDTTGIARGIYIVVFPSGQTMKIKL